MFRALRTFTMNGRKIGRGDILDTVPAHLEGTFLRAGFIEPHQGRDVSTMTRTDLVALAGQVGVAVPPKAKVAELRELLKGVS